jgi:hypothetical protein
MDTRSRHDRRGRIRRICVALVLSAAVATGVTALDLGWNLNAQPAASHAVADLGWNKAAAAATE